MSRVAVAMQFDEERFATAVVDVLVRAQLTWVFNPAKKSGAIGSRLIAVTTNTSRSNGERFKSVED